MKIIIYNYYKYNFKCNLIIYLLKYNKRITINSSKLKKDGNNAYYIYNPFKYCKHKIYLTTLKHLKIEILLDNKSLFSNKTGICYFDFINKNNIKILTKNEYNKDMSLLRRNKYKSSMKYWHLYWNCLHYLSYIYPDNPSNDNKNQIIILVNKMKKNGIKCSYCRRHFNKWCSNNDIQKYVNNKNNLISFFINLHNDINLRNKKKIFSKDEVDKIYLNFDYNYLLKYKLDVLSLFKKNKLNILPDIINSQTRYILLNEFDIIKFA